MGSEREFHFKIRINSHVKFMWRCNSFHTSMTYPEYVTGPLSLCFSTVTYGSWKRETDYH